MHLTYRSEIDGTEQPYRVFVPGSYSPESPRPLVIALHGTGRDENTLFDHPDFGAGNMAKAADERGMIVVCPYGRGITEYRGVGENDVFQVLEEVRKRFSVDPRRIYLTGHSMGGSGTSYLTLRHPDVFAAVAPLASSYAHPELARNARHTPFWFISGESDWVGYLDAGPKPLSALMQSLGCPADMWLISGADHRNFMPEIYPRLFDWFLKHKLNVHPRDISFAAYLPIHGQAWWISLAGIEQPGPPAVVEARIGNDNRITIDAMNASELWITPDPELLDLARPVRIAVNGSGVFSARIPRGKTIRLTGAAGTWRGDVAALDARPLTGYQTHKIGTVVDPPTVEMPESPMGNFIADAMREATGADIAICNHRHERGIPLKPGDLTLTDLVNYHRPFNRVLVTFEATGQELIDIIEANLAEEQRREWLVQISGARYEFTDKTVVDTDIARSRTYTVVTEDNVPQRESMKLAGRFGKIDYERTNIAITAALWAHVQRNPEMRAVRDGRVKER